MLTALILTVAGDLTVLGPDAHRALHDQLLAESRKVHEANDRARALAALDGEDMLARQAALRSAYGSLLGPMPERTPLNTEVVGWLEADGYRVARLHFESRPGHHVTANLYVPRGEGPFPGIAVPCGHSDNGKAYDSYQRACALFATRGMVALIYDPVGQGERHQLELSRHGTTEHTLLNVAGLLVGEPLVKFELWDGSRAIDALLERPELGGARSVGLAGNSGGGTQTVFLAAWDQRVAAATPACYVMQQQRIFETIGAQDGCQWLPLEGVHGLDHPDYLSLFAPRPMRVLAAEQDFFEFASTRAAVEQAGEVWRVLGGPPLELSSVDQTHGWSVELRQASAQWMARWLLGNGDQVIEPELEVFTDEELQVTSTGQVRGAFEGERTIPQLLAERAADLRRERPPLEDDGGSAQSLRAAIGVTGCELQLKHLRDAELEGRTLRLGTMVGGLLALPYAELAGDSGTTLLLHDKGKLAEPELLLKAWARGRRVVALDLSGYGELADRSSAPKYRNTEYRVAMLGLHLGQPLLGRRVGEVLAAIEALGAGGLELVGVGGAGVVALHAAYLDRRVSSVQLIDTIHSWERDVVGDPARPEQIGNVVPGILAHHDLPDLEAALGGRVGRRAR